MDNSEEQAPNQPSDAQPEKLSVPPARSNSVVLIGPGNGETPELRRRRLRGEYLIKVGLLLFVLSMFLPVNSRSEPGEFLGYHAFLASYALMCCYGPSMAQSGMDIDISNSRDVFTSFIALGSGAVINSSILLLPLIAIKNRPRIRWCCAGMMLFCSATTLILPVVFFVPGGQNELHNPYSVMGVGYYVWTLSCFVVGTGMTMRCRFPRLEQQ